MISIVVPCYNEEKAIPLFMDEIKKVEQDFKERVCESFEYIFVDDGSSDKTPDVLRSFSSEVNYIILSRNFGKESAMYAGLKAAKGDYVAIMDVDLQDPPSLLAKMYESIKNSDYDCAAARRCTRKGEPAIRSFFARQFYKLINKISDADIADGARDYRLMKRKVVDAILSMKEYNRFSKGIFGWVGFKTKWISYENVEGVPVITDGCGYVVCKLIDKMETSTHTVFLGEIIAGETGSKAEPMTYAYYHNVIKGKSPKIAPTYIPEETKAEPECNVKVKHVCSVCGFEYCGDPLPEGYTCPVGRQPASVFKRVEE